MSCKSKPRNKFIEKSLIPIKKISASRTNMSFLDFFRKKKRKSVPDTLAVMGMKKALLLGKNDFEI